MEEKKKRKKKTKKENPEVQQQGLYEKALDDTERLDFHMAADVDGIDDEIALLRIEIKKAMSGGDISNLKSLVAASNSLERMIRTKYKISGDKRKGLRQGIYNVLRDVAIPMGINVGADIIKKELNMK